MNKVGLFLGVDPGSGGMFQYSLAILEALSGLPRDRYELIVGYFNPRWLPYINSRGLNSVSLGGGTGREPLTFGLLWRLFCLPLGPWKKLRLWKFDRVARSLTSENCDLWIFPAQDHWGFLAPVSGLVAIHDLMHRYESQFPEVSKWGRYFIREYRFRNICKYAKAVLVDSQVGREHVMESYGLLRKKIFPLPYLPPDYIFSSESADFDQRYVLPPKFIFYPAQFWEHKNHDRLLLAIRLVRKKYPDIALVLAGPKRYRYPMLLSRVKELGLEDCVLFMGYIPDGDLSGFYRRATALVMPTFFGPTNIPPLEAFVLGCPVATSDIYGIPDQVKDAALLFDPKSVQDMALAIEKLWGEDETCAQLASSGKKRATLWQKEDFKNSLVQIVSTQVEASKAQTRVA